MSHILTIFQGVPGSGGSSNFKAQDGAGGGEENEVYYFNQKIAEWAKTF